MYFIVCSLVNHVTDEEKKEAAKARATAGKCHDQHHSWWDILLWQAPDNSQGL